MVMVVERGWVGGAEPGGGSSVVKDDLDKTGHVCLSGVMHGEKRVFLQQKEVGNKG